MLYKLLHPFLIYIMKFSIYHKINILNSPPDILENAIYAVNHSCSHDMPIASIVIKKHIYVLAGKQRLKMMDRMAFKLNGVIWVDRKDKKSKSRAKDKMLKLLKKGRSICMYPEGTWNLTPSKPVIPLYWGCVVLAKEANVPIIPLVLEYRGNTCFSKFGQPIWVYKEDLKQDKINELEDAFSTLKWEIWEMFPIIHRKKDMVQEWDTEVHKRLSEYPLLDYEYERSCVRKRK